MNDNNTHSVEAAINRRLDHPTASLTPAFRALADTVATYAPAEPVAHDEVENLPADTGIIHRAHLSFNAPTTTPAPDTPYKKHHARQTNGLRLTYYVTDEHGTALDGTVTVHFEDIPHRYPDVDDPDTYTTNDKWSHLNPQYEIAGATVTVTHRPVIPADERNYDAYYPEERELNKYSFLDEKDGVAIADVHEAVEYAIAFLKTIGDPVVSEYYYEQQKRAEKLEAAADDDTGDGQVSLTAF